MIKRSLKWLFFTMATILVFNLGLAVATNVSTAYTAEDEQIFRNTLSLSKPAARLSFEQELALIRKVQAQVLQLAPVGKPIPDYQDREPADLFAYGSGLCYDRARTYDKVFSWLGFESRHVYILYGTHAQSGQPMSFWRALLTKGAGSHAVTEVKTSRGWVVVDSNSPWISVLADGTPVDADHIARNAAKFESIPEYFNTTFWAIRGLYSRRGHFYRPYIPYPELNWADFLAWLWGWAREPRER